MPERIERASGAGSNSVPEGQRGPVSVAFVPFDQTNPYQQELAGRLRLFGYVVTGERSLKGLFSAVLLGRRRYQIIHLHWLPVIPPTPLGLLRALVLCGRLHLLRLIGVRFVWTAHNLYNHELLSPRLEACVSRCVARIASGIIVHSNFAKHAVAAEFLDRQPEKIVVLPHGHYIDSYPNTVSTREARLALGIDLESTLALFLGSIRPYKGLENLLRAFRDCSLNGVELWIAGRAMMPESAMSTIEAMIAEDSRVRTTLEFVEDEKIQLYMNACDVVVFPYRNILTSGAVLLAMSFGKACIAPRLGGITEVLDDKGAFFFDAEDPDALRIVLTEALRDRDKLADSGAYNLKRCRAWDWRSIAEQTAEVYDRALRAG